MKEFNYKQAGKDIGWNFSKIDIYTEYPDNYNYYKRVIENLTSETLMLDIGCGSAEKSIRYFSLAKKVYAFDIEPNMLEKAKANVLKYYGNTDKFEFMLADKEEKLNFEDETFDVVVSRHVGANMSEVYRVLKKGGVFISEDIDDFDCLKLKEYYNRGQNFGMHGEGKKEVLDECFHLGFKKIELLNFDEIEYFKSIDDLKYLLDYTPILGGFDDEKDMPILKKYAEDFKTEKGIRLDRKLYAFFLVK